MRQIIDPDRCSAPTYIAAVRSVKPAIRSGCKNLTTPDDPNARAPNLSTSTLWFGHMEELPRTLRLLYTGQSQRARRFRYGLIVFDAQSIIYFIATVALPTSRLRPQ